MIALGLLLTELMTACTPSSETDIYQAAYNSGVHILPQPAHVSLQKGEFVFRHGMSIYGDTPQVKEMLQPFVRSES